MASLRSSTRRTPRKKYTVDAFEGIAELQSDISSEDGEVQNADDEDEEDAEEFEIGAEASDIDDDAMSGIGGDGDDDGEGEDVEDLASDAGEADLDDGMAVTTGPDQRRTRRRHWQKKPVLDAQGQQVYVRGVIDDRQSIVGIPERQLYFFGPTEDDHGSAYRARRRWGHELCLPSRKTATGGFGGFCFNAVYEKEVQSAETNWRWYVDGGRQAFQDRQLLTPLTSRDASRYIPIDGEGDASFVIGPINQQTLFTLKARQCIPISEPFQQPTSSKKASSSQSNYKTGFVINLGARVNCLDWAPNQSGSKQYLAVSLLSRRTRGGPSVSTSEANVFAALPAYENSIQIWEFEADEDKYIENSKHPRLSMVLCCAMGSVRDLKWCPVPSDHLDRLGLLGCVSADGAIRVFDIGRPLEDQGTANILVDRPAFMSKPPDTVCTSLAWLSSARIAASCANGFIAVWDFTKSPNSANPRPEKYIGVSNTYILSIVSGYPSFPSMLMASSMSGYITLTDLNERLSASPAGTAQSNRSRIGQSQLVWHDLAHMAMSCDDSLTVRAYAIRRWFNTVGTSRLRSSATAMAVSNCHPFVLVGTASGEVVGHNPLKRVIHGSKTDTFQQIWFSHEWRRPNEDERKAAEASHTVSEGSANDNETTTMNIKIGQSGLSRISEGFKAQPVAIASKEGSAPNAHNGIIFNTIYEEKSAVTSVAWNPNLHVAGWAAAGMADGLLRVEDIAS